MTEDYEKIRNQVNILIEHLRVEDKRISDEEINLLKKFVDMTYNLNRKK